MTDRSTDSGTDGTQHSGPEAEPGRGAIDRRTFVSGAIAAGALGFAACDASEPTESRPASSALAGKPHVKRYVRLGRTEMKISDISMGTGGVDHPNTVRHAYDLGINYFDTAEIYEKGQSERFIGEALAGKRDKVYLATKAMTKPDWNRHKIMASLNGSLKRLRTDYVDVYFNQAVNEIARMETPEWREFAEKAKQQGKVRFFGVSGHGGRLNECLDYALDHDLVDVILASHNFGYDPAFYEKFTKDFDLIANVQGVTRLFEKARKQDVGVIAMKTLMGARMNDLTRFEWGGATLAQAGFRWVLSNRDVNALIISMRSPQQVEDYLAGSGNTVVRRRDERVLREYVRLNSQSYCRNGCEACLDSCPAGVPIADVLRARMYELRYEDHGKAVDSYARLGAGASPCTSCATESCLAACPYELDVPGLARETNAILGLT